MRLKREQTGYDNDEAHRKAVAQLLRNGLEGRKTIETMRRVGG
jgi:hypothetical protein